MVIGGRAPSGEQLDSVLRFVPGQPARRVACTSLKSFLAACAMRKAQTLLRSERRRAVITRGAEAIGCEAGGHDELMGIMIDCPDGGRIVFGRDSGENMREEKEGEPYPIEVHCFRSLADKCQQTIDRIMAEGKK